MAFFLFYFLVGIGVCVWGYVVWWMGGICHRQTTYVTFCMLPCTTKPFQIGPEFDAQGSNSERKRYSLENRVTSPKLHQFFIESIVGRLVVWGLTAL